VPYAAIEHEGPDVVMAFERLSESGQRADATKACLG
jgi:hypothetical protein